MSKFFNSVISASLIGLGALPMIALSAAHASTLVF
jgi:hypothetical protein